MRRGNAILGGVIILVGLLFLLETLDIVNINVWGVIWSVALIIAGIWILRGITYGKGDAESEAISIPTEGAEQAHVKIRHGAGRLEIGPGAGSDELLSGTVSSEAEVRSKMIDGKMETSIGAPRQMYVIVPFVQRQQWILELNGQIPLELVVKSGANESRIDLSRLMVTDLRLDTGASDTVLTMPATVALTKAGVKGGVASVRINIPEGVAARIHATAGLSNVSINRNRFPRSGRYYQSADYEEAEFRVELDLTVGVGSVTVR